MRVPTVIEAVHQLRKLNAEIKHRDCDGNRITSMLLLRETRGSADVHLCVDTVEAAIDRVLSAIDNGNWRD